jgi:Mg2+ and Co2+ transporter CorA
MFRFIFGEAFLGFLALVAGALTLVPVLFAVSAATNHLLEVAQWTIVALFAVEYAAGLIGARSKPQFVCNPWRIVDAVTIFVPLLTLLPGVSNVFRSSLVLRMVRVLRVVSLGVRASGVMVREERAAAGPTVQAPIQIRIVPDGQEVSPRSATLDEFARWAKQPGEEWCRVTNVGSKDMPRLAAASGISEEFIAAHLMGNSYPHMEAAGPYLSLFVWVPELARHGVIERAGVLLLASRTSVVTFSRRTVTALDQLPRTTEGELRALPFPVRMTHQLLRFVLDSNEKLVARFEQQLGDLEDLPVRESRPQFFERTFRLKKELSAAQSDLWRLRGVLKELCDGRVKLPGQNGQQPLLHDLEERAEYLYETVNNIREGVLSLIELHLNVVSFEMNRVMRVLAVVSVLGLIPAVVGGLFGMNLKDNPWPFTLPQVTFGVCFTMLASLYLFVVKGWLR